MIARIDYFDEKSIARASADIRDAVDHAGMGITTWNDVAEVLRSYFPGSVWWVINQRKGRSRDCNFFAASGLPHQMIDEYLAHYYAVNPWTSDWIRRSVGATAVSERDGPIRLHAKTEYYDWLTKVGDIDAASGIKLGSTNEDVCFAGMHFPLHLQDEYGAASERILRDLSGNFNRAVDMNARLADVAETSAAAAALVRRSEDIAVVVSDRIQLRDANASALESFARPDGIMRETDGHVKIANDETQAWLADILRRLQAKHTVASATSVFRQGDCTWSISVAPVMENTRNSKFLFPARAQYLILLRNLTTAPNIDRDGAFARYHGLTPSERWLCQLLAQGNDLNESADQMQTTRETARGKLKSIFQKTGVNRQAELVSLMMRAVW